MPSAINFSISFTDFNFEKWFFYISTENIYTFSTWYAISIVPIIIEMVNISELKQVTPVCMGNVPHYRKKSKGCT